MPRKTHRETTSQTTQFAKELRGVMTPAERLLWSRLRRNTLGYHFRRQAPVGKFVLDFYCVKAGFAIEVDGDVHAAKLEKDSERTSWLENQKHIRVLRVTNQEVMENIEGVINFILQQLEPPDQPPPLPSPVKKTP